MDLSIFIALAGVLSGFWFGFFGFGEFFLSFLLYLLSGLWQLKNKRSDGARLGLCFDLLCFVSSRLFFDAAVLDLIAFFLFSLSAYRYCYRRPPVPSVYCCVLISSLIPFCELPPLFPTTSSHLASLTTFRLLYPLFGVLRALLACFTCLVVL